MHGRLISDDQSAPEAFTPVMVITRGGRAATRRSALPAGSAGTATATRLVPRQATFAWSMMRRRGSPRPRLSWRSWRLKAAFAVTGPARSSPPGLGYATRIKAAAATAFGPVVGCDRPCVWLPDHRVRRALTAGGQGVASSCSRRITAGL